MSSRITGNVQKRVAAVVIAASRSERFIRPAQLTLRCWSPPWPLRSCSFELRARGSVGAPYRPPSLA